MPDSELDQLERDLTQAAEIWFSAPLHRKLQRLIEIARSGEQIAAQMMLRGNSMHIDLQVVSEQPVMRAD